MDIATRNPRHPATRLDVQRHHLEDQRASHAHMEVNAHALEVRGNREGHLTVTLRSIRASIANLLIAAGERISQKPIPEPVDTPVTS